VIKLYRKSGRRKNNMAEEKNMLWGPRETEKGRFLAMKKGPDDTISSEWVKFKSEVLGHALTRLVDEVYTVTSLATCSSGVAPASKINNQQSAALAALPAKKYVINWTRWHELFIDEVQNSNLPQDIKNKLMKDNKEKPKQETAKLIITTDEDKQKWIETDVVMGFSIYIEEYKERYAYDDSTLKKVYILINRVMDKVVASEITSILKKKV